MSKKLITVTSSAIKQLKRLIKEENAKGILLSVKGGGCAGLGYQLETINQWTNEKNLVKEKDLIIEVCDKSVFFLLGTNIGWKEDIMGKGFTFDNPMAQSSCGCGTSFSPKQN